MRSRNYNPRRRSERVRRRAAGPRGGPPRRANGFDELPPIATSAERREAKPDFSNPIAGFGANLLAPLFRGGALKAQAEIRTSEQREAVARYGGVVLRAFQEVEDSLTADSYLRRREQVLSGMVRDTARSVELSERQYEVGRIAMLSLVQERMRLYAAESALIRIRAERLVQRVNLHLVLGGDFAPPSASEETPPRS